MGTRHLTLALTLFAGLGAQAGAGEVRFTRDIRPILAANCLACHGADDKQRKADLRLDSADSATAPAKGGLIAVVPGKPGDSELIKRISAADPADRMPPAKSGKKPLSPEQIKLLNDWIASGAKYESHWAFAAPVRPPLPEVNEAAWAANPIDRFIFDRLKREGLSPSPQADKITLLRRLSLDLIGLPPTVEEVDAFVTDNAPDAYQKQVERLLASPHYGELWGRHWLDAARYADSDGFEKDKMRFVWFYRDWVINAFNQDLPYDKFIIDQIAGDQLPNATQDQIVATGFLRNSMLNEEGGVDPEQFRMDEMFDRMDVIGKAMLGLTIQCAQCHSHKFDPISQEEYYRLFAFLNNDSEACRVVYTTEQQLKIADLTTQMRNIEAELKQGTPDWDEQMARWEQEAAKDQPQWTVVPMENAGDGSQRYIHQKDGSLLAQGYAPTKFSGNFEGKVDLKHITAFRLDYLTHPDLPCGGPGRSIKGTCALSEFSVEAAPANDSGKRTRIKFASASADFDQPDRPLESIYGDNTNVKRITGPVKYAIDGDDKTAWGMDAGPGRRNADRNAVFVCDKPIDFDSGAFLHIELKQNHGGWNSDDNQNNNLGRFRVSVTSANSPKADPVPSAVRRIFAIPRDQRTAAQQQEIFSYWRTTLPQWKDANDRIESLWQQWPEGATQLVSQSRVEARETHMLTRGDWLKPNRAVIAGVPAFLHSLPENAPPTRLTLANWLVDKKSPTTARAFVNRVWQAYFGTGIVNTPEDFGTQGEIPSHPELLDWLACEFMAPSVSGDASEPRPAQSWSIKHIHRLIVNSMAYRQSSRADEQMLARDPYDRLIERGPRFRVEGEIVHDIALADSGLLNEKMGGKPVMPPAPAFLFVPPTSYGPFPWIDETGPEKYRRAVYTFRRRSTPFPMLLSFDVPNGEASCIRRARTNSPLQALVSMNEPMFVECARSLAKQGLTSPAKDDAGRLTYMFRRVLSRQPAEAESKELLALLEKERNHFGQSTSSADELAGKGADLPPGVNSVEMASWTIVGRVLLNLDEAISKE